MLVLAVLTPLDTLAETSSEVLLLVFVMINLALVWFKIKGVPATENAFTMHIAFPIVGVVLCLALLLGEARRLRVGDGECGPHTHHGRMQRLGIL